MIQLANDPQASRTSWRPAAHDGKTPAADPRRARSGHSWPFLSPYAGRPAKQGGSTTQRNDSGS